MRISSLASLGLPGPNQSGATAPKHFPANPWRSSNPKTATFSNGSWLPFCPTGSSTPTPTSGPTTTCTPPQDRLPAQGRRPPGVLPNAAALHPGRACAANIFHRICPPEHFEGANLWTSRQVACNPQYRGLFLTGPEAGPEWLRQEVRRLGLAGLKCYHVLRQG